MPRKTSTSASACRATHRLDRRDQHPRTRGRITINGGISFATAGNVNIKGGITSQAALLVNVCAIASVVNSTPTRNGVVIDNTAATSNHAAIEVAGGNLIIHVRGNNTLIGRCCAIWGTAHGVLTLDTASAAALVATGGDVPTPPLALALLSALFALRARKK